MSSTTSATTGPPMVDWDLAVTTGTRLVPPGPAISADEARSVVAELRAHALAAQQHVRDVTGLHAPGGAEAVAVIDRRAWIKANAAGFRVLLTPLVDRLQAKRPSTPVVTAVGSRLTGIETGSLLAYLATKVLGQYELFSALDPATTTLETVADDSPGRLLLVAPNIVSAEREMDVDPRDFRLWVCVHEETHRVQFGAVPWLRRHLVEQVTRFVDTTDVDPAALLGRLGAVAQTAYEALKGDTPSNGSGSLLEAIQTPEQRAVLDHLTAVMSLLEGHADVVMDAVGPVVIPSVAEIRARFQRRRESVSRPEQVLRRLLGVDAKLAQYRDGARFVRAVVDAVGMERFNAVWAEPANLPTRDELAEPQRWVARVHGAAALPA